MTNIYHDDVKIKSVFNYRRALVFICYKNIAGLTCKTRQFTGAVTIARFKLKQEKRVQIELTVNDGKAKLVAVKDGMLSVLMEAENYQHKTITLNSGKYRLRVVAVDATFTLTMTNV